MSRSRFSLVSALVGVAVFLGYGTLAVVSGVILWSVVRDPPPLWVLPVAFVAVVLVLGYVAHRLGTIQLLTSLQSRELSRTRAPSVYRRLDRLAATMDLRKPRLLLSAMDAPNAFSLGTPSQSAIVLDSALFSLLTADELEAILAHELAHIERRDTLVKTLVLTAMRLLVSLVLVLLAPITIMLLGIDRGVAWMAGRPGQRQNGLAWGFQRSIQFGLGALFSVLTLAVLAYSRKREFAADSRAAEVTEDPFALARALAKIHRASTPRRSILSVLYVEQEQQRPPEWLSTHPQVERRIERLLAQADLPVDQQTVTHHRS